MIKALDTNSKSTCLDFSFADSYVTENVIQANIRHDYHGYDEDAEFLEIMQLVADQFDAAFRRLAD